MTVDTHTGGGQIDHLSGRLFQRQAIVAGECTWVGRSDPNPKSDPESDTDPKHEFEPDPDPKPKIKPDSEPSLKLSFQKNV